jgi:tRNA modification GTPase
VTEEMGILEIEDKIEEIVYGGWVKQEGNIIITQVRHQELLERADQSCKDALVMIHQKEALDFIEVDIRNAHEALGEIIGETIKDDVINEVFNRFCLGK